MDNKLKAVKIMPLGDSITYDNSFADVENPRPIGERIAYRFELYKLLKQAGHKFSFIGNRRAGFNYFTEANNAGFPGCTAKQLSKLLKTGYNEFEDIYEVTGNYFEFFKPDLILLHIGSNHTDKTSPKDIDKILDIIQENNKQRNGNPITTFIARIIDQYPHNPNVSKLNNDVDEIVKNRMLSGESIIRVDMESALDYENDMEDRWHPDFSGYKKIAAKWFEAISEFFNS